MIIIRLGLLLTAIFSACGLASAQTSQCSVVTFRRDSVTKTQASARIVLGSFEWQGDKPLAGVFQHQSTGLFTAVKVERVAGVGGNRPKDTIRLAISFVGKPGDVFDDDRAAEAEATYDRNWKWLSVSKNIKVAEQLHTFYLRCDRGSFKLIRIHP